MNRHVCRQEKIRKKGPKYSMSRFPGEQALMTIIPCLKNPRSFDQSSSFYVESFQAPNKLLIKTIEELVGRGEGD